MQFISEIKHTFVFFHPSGVEINHFILRPEFSSIPPEFLLNSEVVTPSVRKQADRRASIDCRAYVRFCGICMALDNLLYFSFTNSFRTQWLFTEALYR